MNVIDTSGMTRDQRLALRRESIGASDAAVIAGLSRYKSRFGLWLEKTSQGEPEEAGEEAWWGTELERAITARLIQTEELTECSHQLMVRSETQPWMTATLDALDSNGRIWEFKAAGIGTARSLENGNPLTLPDAWILQAHHQMHCMNRSPVRFAVFIGHRLQMYRFNVEFDDEVADGLIQIESEFRRHVETMTPPAEFDAMDAALLLRHYREIDGPPLELSPIEYGDAVNDFEEATSEIAYAEATRDKAKARLLAAMGNAPAASCGPYRLRRSIVNVKAQEPKPRAAYSYTKFTFTNTESDE